MDRILLNQRMLCCFPELIFQYVPELNLVLIHILLRCSMFVYVSFRFVHFMHDGSVPLTLWTNAIEVVMRFHNFEFSLTSHQHRVAASLVVLVIGTVVLLL